MATARRRTTASWSSRRWDELPSVVLAQWRERPRPSPSPTKWMAGTSASPATICQYNRFLRLDRKRASTLGLKPLPRSHLVRASFLLVGIAKPHGRSQPPNGGSRGARREAIGDARP